MNAESLSDQQPITEDWLRANGWRSEGSRNDPRLPVRRRCVGGDVLGGRPFMGSTDDLCIDVAPNGNRDGLWFVWIMQVEPYRHIHVRFMRYTWELALLYEGLTGREYQAGSAPSDVYVCWPESSGAT